MKQSKTETADGKEPEEGKLYYKSEHRDYCFGPVLVLLLIYFFNFMF